MGSALSLITVDRASPVPLYFQVAQHLERAIESGELPPGAQLEAATLAEARLLEEAKGAPLLTMERTTYDDQGRAVEHGTHIYRASRYSFELALLAR